jgi:hypothetical protein
MTGIVGTFQRNQAPMWPDGQPGTLDNNPLGNNPLGNNPLDNNPENNQVWSAKLGRDMRQATDPELILHPTRCGAESA